MQLSRFLAKSRIIDLESSDLTGVLNELLDTCNIDEVQSRKDKVLKNLLDREKNMSTYLGDGIIFPNIKIKMKRRYVLLVGRAPNGIDYENMDEYKEVRLVFVLIASQSERNYLNVLASLAKVFQEKLAPDSDLLTLPLADFQNSLLESFGAVQKSNQTKSTKSNRFMLREARRMAKGMNCDMLLVFGDIFSSSYNIDQPISEIKQVLVSNTGVDTKTKQLFDEVITIGSASSSRLSQLRSAVLIGLTRGVIKFNDQICCLSGRPKSNEFDTVVVIDVEKEFKSVLSRDEKLLPDNVQPEILERVFSIATELALEGREGKPVGCLFVVGDANKINQFSKPLVLNPFFGYKDEDRNVLNPFMDETVKEFSSIDGAFIIRGDGVIDSAGTLLHTPEIAPVLPSGLGSRHSAAAAISQATDCIAIVVSSSTGQVTVFRNGEMLPLIERVQLREE